MIARRTPANPNLKPFYPGRPKTGGRKKGVQNKATRQLKEAVLLAAEQTGEDRKGKDGLLGYLRMLAKSEPRTFTTLLVKAIPMEIAGDAERPVVVTLDESILAHLGGGEQELLRAVLRAVAAGGPAITAALGPQRPTADPSRYAETLRQDTETAGQA